MAWVIDYRDLSYNELRELPKDTLAATTQLQQL